MIICSALYYSYVATMSNCPILTPLTSEIQSSAFPLGLIAAGVLGILISIFLFMLAIIFILRYHKLRQRKANIEGIIMLIFRYSCICCMVVNVQTNAGHDLRIYKHFKVCLLFSVDSGSSSLSDRTQLSY